jgi:hypothetical protein
MEPIYFAGIGSRETPKDIAKKQKEVGIWLAKLGLTLRTGGADGSDTNFEEAYTEAKGKLEVWLPWKGFNGRKGTDYLPNSLHFVTAATIHPAWQYLTRGPRALHARNIGQVLGEDINTPVAFVLCWTRDGANSEDKVTKQTGGTGTAIRLASRCNIPIINMFNDDWEKQLNDVLVSLGLVKTSCGKTSR